MLSMAYQDSSPSKWVISGLQEQLSGSMGPTTRVLESTIGVGGAVRDVLMLSMI